MNILLTNDDGIYAPGLKIAREIASSIAGKGGKVIIVAPASEQSGVAHSISYVRPSLIEQIEKNTYSVEGTPADCILAGIDYAMNGKKPDLIISGVNRGQNIAEDVLYSGTIGAAMEGAIHGIKSIALSQSYSKKTVKSPHLFDSARKYAVKVCKKLLLDDPFLEKDFNGFYNINFPACKADQVLGVKVCKTGLRQENTFSISSQTSSAGKTFLWMNHNPTSSIPSPKSDGAYLKAGYVTVSALQTELNWIEKNRHLKSLFEV